MGRFVRASSIPTRLFLLFVLLSAATAQAQDLRTTVIEDDGTRLVLEFSVDWSQSLAAAVDSSGITEWTPAELDVFAAGLASASYTLDLPVLERPVVRVTSRQYDEVQVMEPDASAQGFSQGEVDLVGLGMYRKRPVVDVVAGLVRVNRQQGVLQRVRRMRVDVTRPEVSGVSPRTAAAARSASVVTDSKLADGLIFKVLVEEEGVLRVDRGTITALGLDPNTVDPAQVRILGNGGRPLPALNSAPRPVDLVEQAAVRVGAGDGRFDASDAVVFFADAPRRWFYNRDSLEFDHFVHPFSNENVYFIKIDPVPGSLTSVEPFLDVAATPFETVDGFYALDVEEFNWSREHGSGQDWVSNPIRSGSQRRFLTNHVLPGLVAGTIRIQALTAVSSNPAATVAFESDGVVLGQRTAPGITRPGAENPSAVHTELEFTRTMAAGEPLNLTMRLLQQTNEPEAALDWLRVFYERRLTASDDRLVFFTRAGAAGDHEYVLDGFSARPVVLDVTGGQATRALEVRQAGSTWRVQVRASDVQDGPRRLVAFVPGSASSLGASDAVAVPNQNIRATIGLPEFIIVTAEPFRPAANRLADRRRSQGLSVAVVSIEETYNEFSGGVPDMRAIRDLFKFVYDQARTDAQRLRYALLLGDGHFDYRGLSGLQGALANHIPPYETENTIFTDGSYTSDDYFGLLDDNEGIWEYTGFTGTTFERLDLGIGRFPVQTVAEAELMVDKVETYEDPATFGPWRNVYTAIADDGPTGLAGIKNDFDLHMANVDQVAELIRGGLYPEINMDKIYGESFDRVFLNGFKIPEARREILASMNRGGLIYNYSGHGGPEGLAQEEIFTKEDAAALTNGDRLTIFLTATCSFGWWDLEDTQSGAEVLLTNPNGGAVALLTTVRLVYTSGSNTTLNAGLNRALNIALFTKDEDGRPKRLGDVLRETKNTTVGLQGNSRKFNLLGDPTLRVGLPTNKAIVEQLGDTDLSASEGQLKALDRVRIRGRLQDASGGFLSNFNGRVQITVFDALRRVPVQVRLNMPTPFYNQREDVIWRGNVQATGGRFEAEFVVPKDISYSNEPGRISVYAFDNEGHALGFTESFIVGGTSDNPPNDSEGPNVDLFMNDSTFVDGGTTGPDPTLLVRLFDESGINTVGAGVGHELLLVVDDNEDQAVDIASAFVADENSFQSGEVRWPLTDLESGLHTARVRAWDVLNNSSTAEISFEIANDEVLDVRNVYNYPNPMNRETRFVFEHNQPAGTSARVEIRIFTLNGQVIRTIPTEEALPEGILGSGPVQVVWDGRDDDLGRPATGVYLYRVRIETDAPDGSRQASDHIEKLAIIR